MRRLLELTRLAQQTEDADVEAAMRRCRDWIYRQEGDVELVEILRSWRLDAPDWEAA